VQRFSKIVVFLKCLFCQIVYHLSMQVSKITVVILQVLCVLFWAADVPNFVNNFFILLFYIIQIFSRFRLIVDISYANLLR